MQLNSLGPLGQIECDKEKRKVVQLVVLPS